MQSLFSRPICSDTSDSLFSPRTRVSISARSQTESGTVPSPFFHKFKCNSDEFRTNSILSQTSAEGLPNGYPHLAAQRKRLVVRSGGVMISAHNTASCAFTRYTLVGSSGIMDQQPVGTAEANWNTQLLILPRVSSEPSCSWH